MKIGFKLWATCLGLGYLPLPGLCGSAAGLVVAAAGKRWLTLPVYVGFTLVVLALSLVVLRWRAPELFEHDPHQVVIDEACGASVLACFLPSVWWVWVAALLAFRVLDNLKPYPAHRLERLRDHALGVFADDLLVAVYVGVAVVLIGVL